MVGATIVALLWLIASVSGSSGEAAYSEVTRPTQSQAATESEQVPVGEAIKEPIEDSSRNQVFSDLPSISLAQIPLEALDTLRLIESKGPFPYRKDDSVFQNREGILPDQTIGYYREYTVDTPGSNDRGARRIVAGDHGDLYYTDDHYASFSEIVL